MEREAYTDLPEELLDAIALVDTAENRLQEVDPIELYQCALLLDDASIDQDSFDDKAQKALNLCLSILSFTDDNEKFLDAWKRYIRLLLKYKQWHDARNFLTVYAGLSDDADLPAWHYNASAKLSYEIEPVRSLTNPDDVLDLLSKSVASPGGIAQAKSVFKEYVSKAVYHRDNKDIDVFSFKNFTEKAIKFDRSLNRRLGSRWPVAIKLDAPSSASQIEQLPSDEDEVGELHALIADLKQQAKKYQDEIDLLNAEVLSLREKISSQSDEPSKETEKPANEVQVRRNQRALKILILGASQLKQKDIFGIAKKFGLTKDNLELRLDYKKNKRFDLQTIRWISPYSAILIGPIAHKLVGLGDYSSVLQLLEEEGFPPAQAIKTSSGGLKITKSGMTTAFEQIIDKIGAYDPDLVPQAT
ncbi:hypothetical protein ACFL07_00985 [Pseudomonadota bacterium]